MKEKDKFYANEAKERILQESGYACAVCGDRAIYLAHRIAKSTQNIKKYGTDIIHHKLNMVAVCGKPACNDAQNIGMNPRERDKLIREIRAAIGWWEEE